MDLYEKSVMHYLVANGETFVAPQINLGKGLRSPDFIAIRPSQKKAYVVVLTDSRNPDSLIKRANAYATEGLRILQKHLEGRGISDSSWSYRVLLFVRREDLDLFKEEIKYRNNVNILCIEDAIESWRWNAQVWTSDFLFEESEDLEHST